MAAPAQMVRPLLLLLLAPVVAACTPSTGQVERGIERELPRIIGPADRYHVEIEGLRARSGEAARVVAVGRRVQPDDAPTVDLLEVELRDLRYDRRRKRIERLESAWATAHITAADLATFLEQQANIESATVALEPPDRARVTVRPSLAGVGLPPGATLDVTGRLAGEGTRIRFDVSEVTAAGFPLGGSAVQRISQLINPLLDLSEIPIALNVTGVRVEEGMLRVDAEGDATSLRPASDPPTRAGGR